MSRNTRPNVDHPTAAKVRAATGELPPGVNDALNKIKELSEEDKSKKTQEVRTAEVPKSIRELILSGKLSDEFDIGPLHIKISTLSSRHQKEIIKKIFSLSNEEKISNIKLITSAYCIDSINGFKLEDLYEGGEDLDFFEKRFEVISDMQSIVSDIVFTRYEKLLEQSRGLYNDGGTQDLIKN